MTVPGRFTPDSVYVLLADNNLFDQNYSIKENLARAIQRSPIEVVPRLLANLIEIEANSGHILALGEPLPS